MKLSINPFNRNNPMTLKDALVVSLLVASATYCLTFLATLTFEQLMANPALIAFDSIKSWLTTFFGTLITLTGLEKYIQYQEKKQSEEG